MNNNNLIIPLFLSLSTYFILYCSSAIQDLNHIKNTGYSSSNRVEEDEESYYFKSNFTHIITDLIFIEEKESCPQFYSIILPYPLCTKLENEQSGLHQISNSSNQSKNELCYESENEVESLVLKTKNDNQNEKTKLKICSKSLNNSHFRSQQLPFEIKEKFQKTCIYSDTPKRGYLSNGNLCSIRSFEQQCLLNQIKFESQFMISCLNQDEDLPQTYSILNELSCKVDEIACSTYQMFYCIKDTQHCPIVDVQVSQYEIQLEGYERIQKDPLGFFYLRRDDLLENRLTNIKISDLSNKKKVQSSNLFNIEIQKQNTDYEMNTNNDQIVRGRVVEKEYQIFTKDIYFGNGNEIKQFIKLYGCYEQIIQILFLMMESIQFFSVIHLLLKKNFKDIVSKSAQIHLFFGILYTIVAFIFIFVYSNQIKHFKSFIKNSDQQIYELIYENNFSEIILKGQIISSALYQFWKEK